MTAFLLLTEETSAAASLAYVRGVLSGEGIRLKELGISVDDVAGGDREGRELAEEFKHTPDPLLRSWRAARQLEAATRPGDIVVASDQFGLAGIFALRQNYSPGPRRLWTVAADSSFLKARFEAKTHTDLPMPLAAEIDWEIVQYRNSERVLATSEMAAGEVAPLGVSTELVRQPHSGQVSRPPEHCAYWWVPGPVSRRGQSGVILRALTSLTSVHATFSDEDVNDGIWTGTTWEAERHSLGLLGNRVSRSNQPETTPEVIVVGDPFWPPDPATRELCAAGVAVVVPERSVSAVVWPDAATWSDADDLVALFHRDAPHPRPTSIASPEPSRVSGPGRLREPGRVSVGIPVFRDIRFLEECLDSVLTQELQPFEVILADDGSASVAVTGALETLAKKDRRIRITRTEHRGVCVVRNHALSLMTGDCFLLVDSDDILESSCLAKCVETLKSSGDLWGVATWTRFFGAYEGIEAKPPFDARVGRRENPIISTGALVDMRVKDLGIRFAPDLAFLYCEDWHFWSQIVAAGGRMGLVPEALINHRVHESSGGFLRTELAHRIGKARATEPLNGR